MVKHALYRDRRELEVIVHTHTRTYRHRHISHTSHSLYESVKTNLSRNKEQKSVAKSLFKSTMDGHPGGKMPSYARSTKCRDTANKAEETEIKVNSHSESKAQTGVNASERLYQHAHTQRVNRTQAIANKTTPEVLTNPQTLPCTHMHRCRHQQLESLSYSPPDAITRITSHSHH